MFYHQKVWQSFNALFAARVAAAYFFLFFLLVNALSSVIIAGSEFVCILYAGIKYGKSIFWGLSFFLGIMAFQFIIFHSNIFVISLL